MGIESEQFVHPERIPQELYCPICTLVLDNPVQTPSEHLFCEDELLEWLTRSDKCPVTKERLNPDDITTPGRIIVNMLGNLQRFCPNKEHGCDWSGDNSAVNGHMTTCKYKSRDQLYLDISKKDEAIEKLKKDVLLYKSKLAIKEHLVAELENRLEYVERKLKVYDAFFKDSANGPRPPHIDGEKEAPVEKLSDLRRHARIEELTTLTQELKADDKTKVHTDTNTKCL